MNPNGPDYPRNAEAGIYIAEIDSENRMRPTQFRNVVLSQALYGGHDLSGAMWDSCPGTWRSDALENLFWICADVCLSS
jgi:hypothetical protein